MKKLLILLFSIMISFNSYGDIVLYCQDEVSTGFIKKNQSWKQSAFIVKRYTIKFNDDYSSLSLDEVNVNLPCEYAFGIDDFNTLVCSSDDGMNFIYDFVKKRYVFNKSSIFGYIKEGPDSDYMSIGTCQNF